MARNKKITDFSADQNQENKVITSPTREMREHLVLRPRRNFIMILAGTNLMVIFAVIFTVMNIRKQLVQNTPVNSSPINKALSPIVELVDMNMDDWNTYKGKYVSFRHPNEWEVEVDEDQPSTSESVVFGFTKLRVYDENQIQLAKLGVFTDSGGICHDYYFFDDSSEEPDEFVQKAKDRYNLEANIIRIDQYEDEFVLLNHKARWVNQEKMVFIDKDEDPAYFDTSCLNPSMASFGDSLYLVIKNRGNENKINNYEITITREGLNQIPALIKILESFKMHTAPKRQS